MSMTATLITFAMNPTQDPFRALETDWALETDLSLIQQRFSGNDVTEVLSIPEIGVYAGASRTCGVVAMVSKNDVRGWRPLWIFRHSNIQGKVTWSLATFTLLPASFADQVVGAAISDDGNCVSIATKGGHANYGGVFFADQVAVSGDGNCQYFVENHRDSSGDVRQSIVHTRLRNDNLWHNSKDTICVIAGDHSLNKAEFIQSYVEWCYDRPITFAFGKDVIVKGMAASTYGDVLLVDTTAGFRAFAYTTGGEAVEVQPSVSEDTVSVTYDLHPLTTHAQVYFFILRGERQWVYDRCILTGKSMDNKLKQAPESVEPHADTLDESAVYVSWLASKLGMTPQALTDAILARFYRAMTGSEEHIAPSDAISIFLGMTADEVLSKMYSLSDHQMGVEALKK